MESGRLIISQLTPPGRGAVASVLVAGKGAISLVSRHFTPASGKPLESHPSGRIVFGTFRGKGDSREELVVAIHSPERVEVHCHGGALASASVMETLADNGAESLPWQEAAHLLEPDSIAAEARIALAAARTEKTAAILLDQYHGALRQCVLGLAGEIQRADSGAGPLARLKRLLSLAPLGLHLTQPWRVVIAGAPNVGKSSLMNAIVGYQRSIVFDQPGTTRDLLSATTALDGWPIELLDTAGIRDSDDPLEAAGVARARAGLSQAELVILVRDATARRERYESDLEKSLPPNVPLIVAENKVDLLPAGGGPAARPDSLFLSALTGKGLEPLCQQIVRILVPNPPERGEAVPFTQQQQALRNAVAALENSQTRDALASLESMLARSPR